MALSSIIFTKGHKFLVSLKKDYLRTGHLGLVSLNLWLDVLVLVSSNHITQCHPVAKNMGTIVHLEEHFTVLKNVNQP